MIRPLCIVFLAFMATVHLPVMGQDKTASSPKELIQYVRDAHKAGLSDNKIQENALKAGWDRADVAAALSLARHAADSQPSKGVVATVNTQPKSDGSPIPPAGAEKQSDVTSPKPDQPAAAAAPVVPDQPVITAPSAPSADNPQQGTPAENSSVPGDRNTSAEYVIGEGDVLQIHVWNEPAASVANAVVRPDGMITVPLVHQIQVARQTPTQVEKLLTARLQEFDTSVGPSSVTVVVSQINSKKVYMTGALKKEGPIPYTYRMTVMQAISEAGGLTEFAKPKDIYVLRIENGKQHQFRFNYRAVLKGQHIETNIQLVPGDTVVVPH